jgi:hypothetical protein
MQIEFSMHGLQIKIISIYWVILITHSSISNPIEIKTSSMKGSYKHFMLSYAQQAQLFGIAKVLEQHFPFNFHQKIITISHSMSAL